MTLNPHTGRYELPPPRWFNKDTGEYETIKPMYFVDPNNPSLGLVLPSKIIREDNAFRQFMEDKEMKRRLRIQREREEAERAHQEAVNPPPIVKTPRKKDKIIIADFNEDAAQTSFRTITGKMISKRGAAQFTGPSAAKEDLQKKELQERYQPLKPYAPSDDSIEKLPPTVNTEEIINAWKNTPAIRVSPKKKKPTRTEGERVRALVRNKSGVKRGFSFAAMSYRPPNTMQAESRGMGWNSERKFLPAEDDSTKRLKGWRMNELQSTAWWETKGPWKSRTACEDQGRLALNPVTGRLEDLAPSKINYQSTTKNTEQKGMLFLDFAEEDLLISSPRPMAGDSLAPKITFDEFISMS
jgi:hypothetical protein